MRLIFFDIETAGVAYSFENLTPELQKVWIESAKKPEEYISSAALIPEFATVVCCSFSAGGTPSTKIGIEEIHEAFCRLDGYTPCGWNIKGFDIPFLCKHFIKNGLKIPKILSNFQKKPWEVNVIDIMEVWKNNGFSPTKLSTACVFMGIETPKDEINGGDVHELFHSGEIEKITKYCEKDVIATSIFWEKIKNLL